MKKRKDIESSNILRFLLNIHTHTARDGCQLEKTSIFNNFKLGGNRQ